MPETRQVNENDHISKIARTVVPAYQSWKTLWDENGPLQGQRNNPNLLFHGVKDPATPKAYKFPPDTYQWEPDDAQRKENCATNAHHSFKVVSSKVFLRLRVVDENYKPFENATYELVIGGITIDSALLVPDADGVLNVEMPEPSAEVGKLTVKIPPPPQASSPPAAPAASGAVAPSASPPPRPPPIEIVFYLSIGRLDPIQDKSPAGENFLSGAQQRLNNLGFGAAYVDGIGGPATESAIKRFQELCNITPPEESAGKPIPGPQTLDWLEKIHDRPGKPPPPGGSAPTPQQPIQVATQTAPTGGTPAQTAAPVADKQLEAALKNLEVAQKNYDQADKEKKDAYKNRTANLTGYTTANQKFMKAQRDLDAAKKAVQQLQSPKTN